jgi:hypothetical protein
MLHHNAGAHLALNFTVVGLATTYELEPCVYTDRIRVLLKVLAEPSALAQSLLPPALRGTPLPAPDLIMIEHGGDILEAGIPQFFLDEELMCNVKAIVVSCESAVALLGAIAYIESLTQATLPFEIYAAMPLTNPEGFIKRIKPLIDVGKLRGVVDVNKPVIDGIRERRLTYSRHYEQIMSPQKFARYIVDEYLLCSYGEE